MRCAACERRDHAQDLEPRAFANTPVGLNFLIGGYAYAKGTVGTDASVPLEDTEVRLNSAVLAYVRTLDLWGRSGKFDVILPYTWASGSTKPAGQPRKQMFPDSAIRGSGFPCCSTAVRRFRWTEFRDFQPDVIIGTSLEVTAPLSAIRLRQTAKHRHQPLVHLSLRSESPRHLEPLTLELATGVRFYTDNNDFLDGQTLQVSPIYSVQGHLIYSFTPGIWVGLDGLYYTGGRPTIDGKKGETRANARVGLTLTLPVNRYNSVKLYGSTGVYTKTGTDFDLVGIVWQFRWGGGL